MCWGSALPSLLFKGFVKTGRQGQSTLCTTTAAKAGCLPDALVRGCAAALLESFAHLFPPSFPGDRGSGAERRPARALRPRH